MASSKGGFLEGGFGGANVGDVGVGEVAPFLSLLSVGTEEELVM